ncbi:MAG: hypothetical protein KDJ48_11035 [Nitratireductor sp.]|nr:hypothetical protein [Nitratireductor sp.]
MISLFPDEEYPDRNDGETRPKSGEVAENTGNRPLLQRGNVSAPIFWWIW